MRPTSGRKGPGQVNLIRALIRLAESVLPGDARPASVADNERPSGRPSTAIAEDQGAIGGPELRRSKSVGLSIGHNPGILI